MKILYLLSLLFIFVSQSIYAQIENDLKVFDFKGKVKTVRTERAKFIKEKDEIKEDKREPQQLMIFDENGFYTEWSTLTNYSTRRFEYKYYPDGKIKEKKNLDSSEKEVFNYQQNQVEKVTQLENGHILDKWIYSFDDKGNKIKSEYKLIDENLGQRFLSPSDLTVYKYDIQGRLSETAYFNGNGFGATLPILSIHRYLTIYNEKNRISERQALKTDGNLIFKWIYKYNDKGYLEEITRLGTNLTTLAKVTYSDFDLMGNWKKSNSYKISVIEGKDIIEPTETEYRTITYYP